MSISKQTFTKIKNIAHRDMRRWMGVRTPGSQTGVCCDCGQDRKLFREHRSYNDPTVVDFCCMPCNLRRRSATIDMVDVESLATIRLQYQWRTRAEKRAAA